MKYKDSDYTRDQMQCAQSSRLVSRKTGRRPSITYGAKTMKNILILICLLVSSAVLAEESHAGVVRKIYYLDSGERCTLINTSENIKVTVLASKDIRKIRSKYKKYRSHRARSRKINGFTEIYKSGRANIYIASHLNDVDRKEILKHEMMHVTCGNFHSEQ